MAYTPRNPNGQATMANSEPVVLASDQSAIAVTATLVAGGDVDVLTVPAPLNIVGGGAEATALRVTIANDSTGVLSIDDNGGSITIDGTVTVTGVATEATLASLLASSQLIDDTIITLGTATYTEGTSKGLVIGGVRRDADTSLVDTTNEFAPFQLDALGRLKVEVFSGETLPVSLTSTTITGTVAVTQSGTWILGANSGVDIGDVTINNASGAGAVNIQDGGNSITVDGTVSVTGVATETTLSSLLTSSQLMDDSVLVDNAAFTDGTTKVIMSGFIFDEVAGTALTENDAAAARIDSKRAIVNVIEDATTRGLRQGVVDETGASAVDAAAVGGGTPHDSVDSGNPVKMGWKAASALPTAVANADRANGISDLYGRQLTSHIDPAMQVWKSANYTSTQTGTTIWDPAGGKKIAIQYLAISSYATTAARVIIWFGATADTTYTAGTDQLVWAGSFAPSANSKPGMILTLGVAPLFAVTADHELKITTDAAISLDITTYGYEF